MVFGEGIWINDLSIVLQAVSYTHLVYQEQVMLLSRLLADFTRGESDALRKAMGKKLRDKLDLSLIHI